MSTDLVDLIEDLRRGHNTAAAQEALYHIVSGSLLEPLRRRIEGSVRSRLDAEDVLHEAFLRALGGLQSVEFPSGRAFLAWVWRIARNIITDQAKRRSAGLCRFGGSSEDTAPRESRILGRERRVESIVAREDWLDSVLGQLKAREAEVIRLRWLRGMSYEEIGALWKKTPVAVKRFYSRAWSRFRETALRDTAAASAIRGLPSGTEPEPPEEG